MSRHPVLPRQRRHNWSGTLEERWHRSWHYTSQGHSSWSNQSFPNLLTNVGNTLYFVADDGVAGLELWTSDGTSAGTVRVKDIASVGSSSPTALTDVSGMLYFVANDGTSGIELWRSNGNSRRYSVSKRTYVLAPLRVTFKTWPTLLVR